VRSLARRQSAQKQTILEHKGVRMDLLARAVSVHGKPVPLTTREYALLELFLNSAGCVLTRTRIAESIWECHFDLETNPIDVYGDRLRAELKEHGPAQLITTLRGVES
jgi:DNA-binding response OmpR family regulator